MAADYGGSERRHEDPELARWRGGVDARLRAVEDKVQTLSSGLSVIDHTVTRMEGKLELVQREVRDSREEVRQAAKDIEKAREDSMLDLKKTISAAQTSKSAWQFTKLQIVVGAVVAVIAPSLASLLVLALTGQIH